MKKSMVVLGANSAIATALVRYAASKETYHFILVGQSQDRLNALQSDLEIRGSTAQVLVANLADPLAISDVVDSISNGVPQINILVLAYGILGDQSRAAIDLDHAADILTINFNTPCMYLLKFAPIFERQKAGNIVVLSSVAGDRGRQSNFVYGAAKSGLSCFLQGLSHRLSNSGVSVLTVKPGFIDTPMTSHFKKGMLWRTPSQVAPRLYDAMRNGHGEIYLPGFWRWIMAIITCIPSGIFYKTKL